MTARAHCRIFVTYRALPFCPDWSTLTPISTLTFLRASRRNRPRWTRGTRDAYGQSRHHQHSNGRHDGPTRRQPRFHRSDLPARCRGRLLPGPTVVTATRAIQTSLSGPHPNLLTLDSADGMRAAIRENIVRGADLIKIFHSGFVGVHRDSTLPIMSPEELTACVEESHRFGFKVTAHAYGGLSVDQCLEAGVDGIEHRFFMSSRQYARG